jgi:hypothetical protein
MMQMSKAVHYVVAALNVVSAFFAIAAAVLWYRSATFRATMEQAKRGGPEIILEGDVPLVGTLEGQARISRNAAIMAACAAALQGLALIIQAIVGM